MSLGSLFGAAAIAAGISLVSILQAGDWARVSMLARHNFSMDITNADWHQESVQHAVVGFMSRCSFGKCQTLTYIKSCDCCPIEM